MNRDALIAEREAIIAEHGPWGSHNVALPYGLFTIDSEPRGDNYRTVKFLRMVADVLQKPFEALRVLDLGCGEGLYALEFARQGAHVVGIEGRATHLVKAEFCKRALGLTNVEFRLGDVRQVTKETHGDFDVVLCSGILYHLDQPEVFEFISAMRGMCRGMVIIDASISPRADVEAAYSGRTYWGAVYREHQPETSADERMQVAGASLDNETSFWITKHDLVNLLVDVGFTSVFECLAPAPYMFRRGRVTLTATPGRTVHAFNEVGAALEGRRWPALWGTIEPHPDEAGPPGP